MITITIFSVYQREYYCFLGSKNRCFCFRGIGTPVRENDVRGRLSGKLRFSEGKRKFIFSLPSISRFDNVRLLTSRLDITAIKL